MKALVFEVVQDMKALQQLATLRKPTIAASMIRMALMNTINRISCHMAKRGVERRKVAATKVKAIATAAAQMINRSVPISAPPRRLAAALD